MKVKLLQSLTVGIAMILGARSQNLRLLPNLKHNFHFTELL